MDNISHVLEFAAGELSMTCMTPLGEDSWELTPGFLLTLLRGLFASAAFALYQLNKS